MSDPNDLRQPAGRECFAGNGEMAARMQNFDWSKTPVGPVELWPQSLKTTVRIMLTSRYAMWMAWGPELTFFYNDAYTPTLGIKHTWALGSRASKIWVEIWPDIGPRIQSVLTTGEATWDLGLLLYLDRSGYLEETYHTFSYSPLADETGGVSGMLCVVTEETERVIGERRLKTLRDLGARTTFAKTVDDACRLVVTTLGENTADVPFALLYLVASDGRTARLCELSRLPRGTSASPEIIELMGTNSAVSWPLAESLARDGAVPIADARRYFGDGPGGLMNVPPKEAIILPLRGSSQERASAFLVAGISPYRAFDDSYRGFFELVAGQAAAAISNANAYAEERKRAEALAELDRAKTAFFANISHEFRTPLTLMIGPAQDALAEPTSPEQRERLELLHRNALRLQKLVNTLLDFSRIEAGRVQASYEPLELATFTTELASVFSSAVEKAGMRLIVDCEPLAEPVYVDRDMWEKIVLNLLSNAFKFTLKGEIKVTLTGTGDGARLAVHDTGAGISPEQLPYIFERFHRVEGTRARTHEGTGIGLALVQELVRLHGGKVEVESVLGAGTVFHVTVPWGHSHLPADRIGGPGPVAPTVRGAELYLAEATRWLPERRDDRPPPIEAIDHLPPPRETTRTAPRPRILLADDNADMREYVRRLLSGLYDVHPVADGAAALAAARAERPDLVLTDVMMPQLDGFGLLQKLRADPLTATIPVIMLSARAGEEARVEGIQSGADDYLVKPFGARELLARVAAHIELAQARKRAENAVRARSEQLTKLADLAARLHSATDVASLVTVITEEARALIGANQAVTCLADAEGEHTVMSAVSTPAGTKLDADIDFMAHDTAVPLVLKDSYRPRRLTQAQLEENAEWRAINKRETAPEHRNGWLGAALPGKNGRSIGSIQLLDKIEGEFTADDEALVMQLSQMAAGAIENGRLHDELRENDRRKDEFLAMLAHELRNPLAAVGNAVTVLKLSDDAENQNFAKDVIERQTRQLNRLIDDLLDVSRITSGKIRLKKEHLDTAFVLAQAVESVRPLITERQHELVASFERDALPIWADPTRIEQIVVNLLTNAAKYTERGGRIWLTAGMEGERVVITVRDNGIGIPPEKVPDMFKLFSQGERSIARSEGGLGIGLTIVRKLAEMHDGLVSASSEGTDKGSEFVVSLPVARRPPVKQPSSGTGRNATSKSSRILVVDDNVDTAMGMARLLELLGNDVQVALHGKAALETAKAFRPEFILLDIGLPGMDGYEVAATLRKDSTCKNTVIVAISGYGQEDDRRRAREAGFDHHLVKPIDFDTLTTLLRGG